MRDLGLIPGLGRSPGEVKGYPLQYSGLEISMDCIVHGVTNSQTRLSDFHFTLTVFASLKHSCFQTGAKARAALLLASSPYDPVARTLGFHPGYQGLISRQGTKISLQDCPLLPSEITPTGLVNLDSQGLSGQDSPGRRGLVGREGTAADRAYSWLLYL